MASSTPMRLGNDYLSPQLSITNKPSFCTLPVEIRLRVFLLVIWPRYPMAQKTVLLELSRVYCRGIEVAILRTCKQVYNEASHLLYSHIEFLVYRPGGISEFLQQIGPSNSKLLKTLRIRLPQIAVLDPWLQVLATLAQEATGLKHLSIEMKAEEIPEPRRGLGSSLKFVHALGRIRSLEKLDMQGFYGKEWPAYLEKELGIQVHATEGTHFHKPELNEIPTNQLLEYDKRAQLVYSMEKAKFERYQAEVETLEALAISEELRDEETRGI